MTSPMRCPHCPGTTPAANGLLPGPSCGRCEQAERADLLDGFAAATRAELLVQVTHVRLDSVRRHVELAGDLWRGELVGRYRRTWVSAWLIGSRRHCGSPGGGAGLLVAASRLRTPAIRDGARGALPGMALEQLRRRVDEEAMSTLLGPARSSARSRARPAAAGSRSASRAIASSSRAATTENGWNPTEPSMTGASAAVAACGSCWASRNDAKVARISGSALVFVQRGEGGFGAFGLARP